MAKSGPGWIESTEHMTKTWGLPGKNDGANIGRPKPITYAAGGAVEAKKKMGPKLPGGAGGGLGRLAKAKRAARN